MDNFMVTDSNREAVAWIDTWPAWPAPCVVVHGPSGSGKTHLTHVWLARSHGQLITREDLVSRDLESLMGTSAAIAMDNAERIAGEAALEETLFHLYNRIRERQGSLLLTAVHAPAHWTIGLPDLRSRLLASPAVAITAPDDELLAALLIKQFRDRQIDIGMDVVSYLLPRVERTTSAIRDAVMALDRASLAEGKAITITLIRHTLFPA